MVYLEFVFAAYLGKTDVVLHVLNRGCTLTDRTDKTHWTALQFAVFGGRCELVTQLLDMGCDVNDSARKFGATPLHLAVHQPGEYCAGPARQGLCTLTPYEEVNPHQ